MNDKVIKTKYNILIPLLLVLAMVLGLAGCGGGGGSEDEFDVSRYINVVSREAGSGTRGAFVELLGVEVKDTDGSKRDMTTEEAVIANKTDVVMANVAGDKYSIGYISLGSLNENVKALSVDGIDATPENIKNGTYKIARPFNIAIKGVPSPLAQDFIDYILSTEGQKIVSTNYIAVNDTPQGYNGTKPSGKLVVAGSSSVSPVMEKLLEGYMLINPNANIELQNTDSTAGMTAATNGTSDIGMASRELKDSELETLTPIVIAMDGIAMIVNNENPISDISAEMIKSIYIGEIMTWDEL